MPINRPSTVAKIFFALWIVSSIWLLFSWTSSVFSLILAIVICYVLAGLMAYVVYLLDESKNKQRNKNILSATVMTTMFVFYGPCGLFDYARKKERED